MEAVSCVSCGSVEHCGHELLGSHAGNGVGDEGGEVAGAAVAGRGGSGELLVGDAVGGLDDGVGGADGAVGVFEEAGHGVGCLLNKQYPITFIRATYPSRLPFSPETRMWLCIDGL